MSGHRGVHFGHGPGDWGGPRGGWGGGRRRRMRRGDVRAAILVLLDEQPQSGYALMEEIERRSEGAWRPSPGSVYPTLKQLEDEELVRPETGEGRTPYMLTDAGVKYVEEHREALGEPWAKAEGVGEERLELRGLHRPDRRRHVPARDRRRRGPDRPGQGAARARRGAASTASSRTTSRRTDQARDSGPAARAATMSRCREP